MKKIYRLFVYCLAVCGAMMTSCSSDDSDGGAVAQSENSFTIGDNEAKIASVVYSYDKETGIYSFYFSPTAGLIDVNAMLLADDYVKIETKTPAGDINLSKDGNSVIYKGSETSSGSCYVLASVSTVKMTVNVTLDSGLTLVGNYTGYCIYYSENGEEKPTPPMTSQIFARYKGVVKKAGTANYLIAVTNSDGFALTTSEEFSLTSEGYALVLDFYGTPGTDWKNFPTGTFTESAGNEDHTWYDDYSYVVYRDANGNVTQMKLADDVIIKRDNDGKVTIEATYLDSEQNDHEILFSGEIRMADGTFDSVFAQYDDNIEFEGYACVSALYLGDYYSSGSGVAWLEFNDFNMDDKKYPGFSVTVELLANKFNDPEDIALVEGTYTVDDFSFKQKKWVPGYDDQTFSQLGFIMPGGTYATAALNEKSTLYAYGTSGTINVTNTGTKNGYKIEFDLVTGAGFTIKGSYEGDIYLENASDDAQSDQSSTLESDYEMNLEYLTRATCTPQTEIYFEDKGIQSLDYITTANPGGVASGFQIIEIGALPELKVDEEGRHYMDPFDEGDVMRIELLVTPGNEEKITPGVYPITTNRFPISFKPGVSPRGYMSTASAQGTRWLKVIERYGNIWDDKDKDGVVDPGEILEGAPTGFASFDDYACIYAGTVTIEKAEKKGEFTFTINGEDVGEHKVTGTWTGPVYLGDSETLVEASDEEFTSSSASGAGLLNADYLRTLSKAQRMRAVKAAEVNSLK